MERRQVRQSCEAGRQRAQLVVGDTKGAQRRKAFASKGLAELLYGIVAQVQVLQLHDLPELLVRLQAAAVGDAKHLGRNATERAVAQIERARAASAPKLRLKRSGPEHLNHLSAAKHPVAPSWVRVALF
eukprot:scaffold306_cov241-Pinguiococcus_pyrenoidosus.AAC.3